MSKQKYFKITNRNENHYGFQYKDGLNILVEKFNEVGQCCAGGFYFTDIKSIEFFFEYGDWLRDIDLPTEDPEFKMVQDPSGGKWRTNKIIFGKRRSLYKLDTLKYLEEQGASFENSSYLKLAFANDNIEMFQFLISKGCEFENYVYSTSRGAYFPKIYTLIIENRLCSDVHCIENIFDRAYYTSNFSLMKLIFQKYPNIGSAFIFRKAEIALQEQDMDLFKFLLTRTDDFDLTSEILCELFHTQNYFILNYLIGENVLILKGIDFGDSNNDIFIESIKKENMVVINFLASKMDSPTIQKALVAAIMANCLTSVKYLAEKFVIDTTNFESVLVDVVPKASIDLVKYLVETLKIDPTYNKNAAVKRAQSFKNKKVASYLARTSSMMMKSRYAQRALTRDL